MVAPTVDNKSFSGRTTLSKERRSDMKAHEKMLLDATMHAIHKKSVKWDAPVPPSDWSALMELAAEQKVMPLVLEAVFSSPAAESFMDLPFYIQSSVRQVTVQTVKTAEFLRLYRFLSERGLRPMVIKGILLRDLYPMPDHRPSGDEDVLIPEGTFDEYHRAMLDFGMVPVTDDVDSAYEVTYKMENSPLYIELHKHLFPPESEAYGELNRHFENVFSRSKLTLHRGVELVSMNETDHLFYLICHAYKHFIHSGFGIRQICDMALWSEKLGAEIDWNALYEKCAAAGCLKFAAAVFQMAHRHLDINAPLTDPWKKVRVDCGPMLYDLLEAGVYGSADMNRLHSAAITVEAVGQDRSNGKNALLSAVFPSKNKMKKKYPVLNKHPYLLPGMWVVRLAKYGTETLLSKNNSAAESVKIARERTRLLRFYDIMK